MNADQIKQVFRIAHRKFLFLRVFKCIKQTRIFQEIELQVHRFVFSTVQHLIRSPTAIYQITFLAYFYFPLPPPSAKVHLCTKYYGT